MSNLEKLRASQNLSQNKLAQIANINQSVISDIESGKIRSPRVSTAKAIAKALGCTLNDLFSDTP